jgi:SAM-dependent methyltransferase
MKNKLTNKEKWEKTWAGTKLPVIQKPIKDLEQLLLNHLPKNDSYSFIEIGCAPGGWMAYFNKTFGYNVAGVEYASGAAEITMQNLKMLQVNAEVYKQDFLNFNHQDKFDIVFSAGFIEHFNNVNFVTEKVCNLASRYVVTIVPNLFGINGFISKTIRPDVFKEHIPIELKDLEDMHSQNGIKTLFCDYIGGIKIIMLAAHTPFFEKHKLVAKYFNLPFRSVNFFTAYFSNVVTAQADFSAIKHVVL